MNELTAIGKNIILELTDDRVKYDGNYSVENALKSAYLVLEETLDKNNRPVHEVCTKASIQNALLNMCVQGLNPAKNQCYFVIYGSKLQMIRSYMGSQMLAKKVDSRIADIRAEVVYSGDKFAFEIVKGKKRIKVHEQEFGNINKEHIVGAYALSVDVNDNVLHADMMTFDEIKQSWKQSKMRVIDDSGLVRPGTTHEKFSGEMCRRTVINRLCKQIINTSDDTNLILSYNDADEGRIETHIVQEHIESEANKKLLDFKAPEDKPMASREHAKVICDLAVQINRRDEIFDDISAFLDRPISKLSELTEDEAERYIEAQEDRIKEENEKPSVPDWAS